MPAMWDFTQKIECIIVVCAGHRLVMCDFLCLGNRIALRMWIIDCSRVRGQLMHFATIMSRLTEAKPDNT